MNRFDIVGLSLAEIALVLVFVVLAIFAPAYSHVQKELSFTKRDAESLRTKVGDLQKQLDDMKRFKAERPNLRSRATPSCFELNKTTDRWLTSIVVNGVNRYEVGGRQLTLKELLSEFSSEIAQGKRDDCRYSIRISSGKDVSGVDYQLALMQLGQTFYMTQSSPH